MAKEKVREKLETFLQDVGHIPSHHLRGLTGCYIEDINNHNKTIFSYSIPLHGFYEVISKEIILDRETVKKEKQRKNTLTHEIGHHIWHTLLPFSLKLKWKIKLSKFGPYDASESFTDCYMGIFGLDEEDYYLDKEELTPLMQEILTYLEKNKDKKVNGYFHRMASYFLI